jgi:hypothetical protein
MNPRILHVGGTELSLGLLVGGFAEAKPCCFLLWENEEGYSAKVALGLSSAAPRPCL